MLNLGPSLTPPHASPAVDADAEPWAHLWFALMRFAWSTLAVVPAQRDGSALDAAESLAAAGRTYLQEPVYVLDARGCAPSQVAPLLRAIDGRVAGGGRVLVATSSPAESAVPIPVARGVDGAVLVVKLGAAYVGEARRAVDAIGASQFLGAITLGAA